MTQEVEIWKDVPDYEGFQVSDTNRVRRLPFNYVNAKGHLMHMKGHEIKTAINKKGYQRCELCTGAGLKKSFTVHRLVMYAFVGQPPTGLDQINHKDGNKLNNHPDNLEYSNNSLNIEHAWRTGLFNPVLPKGVMFGRSKVVVHTEIGTFYTISEAAKMNNVTRKKMADMLEGKVKNKTNYNYA